MRLWGRDWGRGEPLGLLTMARLASRDDCSAASGYCKLRAPAITGCMESNFLKTTITSEYLQRALNEMLKLATECTDNDDDEDHQPGVRAPGGCEPRHGRGDATPGLGPGGGLKLIFCGCCISAVSCCSMCECGRYCSSNCSRLCSLGSLQRSVLGSAGSECRAYIPTAVHGCMCSETFVRFPTKFSYFCDSSRGSSN